MQQRQIAWEEVQARRRQRYDRAAQERFERLCTRYEQLVNRQEIENEEDQKRRERRREFMTFDFQRKWDEAEIAQKTQLLETSPWIPPPRRPFQDRRMRVEHVRTPSTSKPPKTKPSLSSEDTPTSHINNEPSEHVPGLFFSKSSSSLLSRSYFLIATLLT